MTPGHVYDQLRNCPLFNLKLLLLFIRQSPTPSLEISFCIPEIISLVHIVIVHSVVVHTVIVHSVVVHSVVVHTVVAHTVVVHTVVVHTVVVHTVVVHTVVVHTVYYYRVYYYSVTTVCNSNMIPNKNRVSNHLTVFCTELSSAALYIHTHTYVRTYTHAY